MKTRKQQIPAVDFLKVVMTVASSKGATMADVGKIIGRDEDYVAARLGNLKRQFPNLADKIDKLELERRPVGRKQVSEKDLMAILSGPIG